MKLHACVHGSHAKVTRPPPLQPVQLFPHLRRPSKTLYPTRPLQELDGRGIVGDARGELSPRRPGSTEAVPHAPVKAAAAGSVLGRRRQAVAAGSPPRCRRRNTVANAAQVASVGAARKSAAQTNSEDLRRRLSRLRFLRHSLLEEEEEHVAEGPKEKMSMDLDFSGLGLKEKPKFVKALIALGLPIDTFGLGLGLKPRPSSCG